MSVLCLLLSLGDLLPVQILSNKLQPIFTKLSSSNKLLALRVVLSRLPNICIREEISVVDVMAGQRVLFVLDLHFIFSFSYWGPLSDRGHLI